MIEVPQLTTFREVVDKIPSRRDENLIKALYLCAARASELLGKVTPYDLKHNKSQAYGKYLTWKLQNYIPENVAVREKMKEGFAKALILKMPIAKRKKKSRKKEPSPEDLLVFKTIALPCNPKFEPWTIDLLKWISKHKQLTFPITRQWAWQIVKDNLHQLDPKIHTHSLRHYRITHLIEYYGFDPYEVTIYAGWTIKTTAGAMGISAGSPIDIYTHLTWRRYFPKLLRNPFPIP